MANKIIATVEAPAVMNKESFISMMKSLWEMANKEYRNIYDTVAVPNATAWHEKYAAECIVGATKRAIEYANKKWKTEKRREQYVTTEVAKRRAELDAWTPEAYRPLSFVDFDVNPGTNGLSGNCCLTKFTDEELGRCYDEICNNKYFKSASAFSIGYLDSDSKWRTYYDGLCGFRPQVYMTMPEEMNKMYHDEAEALAEDIRRFYANCHYCGD